jgi:hypothetical protein
MKLMTNGLMKKLSKIDKSKKDHFNKIYKQPRKQLTYV